MADEKILDRIRKLLTLSENNSNPEEAQLAAQRAMELMTRHRIDEMTARGYDPDKIEIVEGRIDDVEEAKPRRVMSQWQLLLASVVVQGNNGKLLRRSVLVDENGDRCGPDRARKKGEITIMFGQRDDIDVARYMFMWLEKELLLRCRHHLRLIGGYGREGNAYLHGLVIAVHQSLQVGQRNVLEGDPGTALVAVANKTREAAEAKMRKIPGLTSTRLGNTRVDPSNFVQGMADGKSIDLSRDRDALGLPSGSKRLK